MSKLKLQMLFVCCMVYACVIPALASDSSRSLEDLIKHERFAEIITTYSKLPSDEKNDALCCYLTAVAYMRRHEFSSAQPLLLHCEREHFLYGNWKSPKLLLEQISTSRRLTPPLYREFHEGGARLTVYGNHDKWLDEVYEVLPTFVTQANMAFGDSPTHINLYMFDNKDAYMEFFKANCDGYVPGNDQSGTGSINFAVFSEFCSDGSSRGVNDLADRRGCVLHEYGHALCSTIYGDDYFRVVPGWLNEGLADLIARPLFGPEFDKYPSNVAQESKLYVPPSYDVLCGQFYGKGAMPYVLAKLMVKEIFGNSKLSQIGRVLVIAKEKHGDFDSAIAEVMKVNPREVYDRIVRTYWSKAQ